MWRMSTNSIHENGWIDVFYYQNCHFTNYHDWANSVQMHCLKQESNSELRAQFSSVLAFVSSPLQSYQLIAFSQETL